MRARHKFAVFRRDESGAALIEFSLVMTFFLLLIGGIVEFSLLFFQWNSATKALQVGARLASVSDPVADGLRDITGLIGGRKPGDAMPSFKIVCNGSDAACTCTGDACPASVPTRNLNALKRIVYGSDFVPGSADPVCGELGTDATKQRFLGMCDIYNRIRPANVVISYEQTGLGFAGRPGGPVPTITIELRNLTFGFIFLQALMRFAPITVPPMRTTAAGEDLNFSAP